MSIPSRLWAILNLGSGPSKMPDEVTSWFFAEPLQGASLLLFFLLSDVVRIGTKSPHGIRNPFVETEEASPFSYDGSQKGVPQFGDDRSYRCTFRSTT